MSSPWGGRCEADCQAEVPLRLRPGEGDRPTVASPSSVRCRWLRFNNEWFIEPFDAQQVLSIHACDARWVTNGSCKTDLRQRLKSAKRRKTVFCRTHTRPQRFAVHQRIQMKILALLLVKIVGIILAADFAGGFVHWLEDAYIREDTPLIGKWVARPNIVHHHFPRYMARFSWWSTSRDLFVLSALLVAIAWCLGVLTWEVWLFAMLADSTNK